MSKAWNHILNDNHLPGSLIELSVPHKCPVQAEIQCPYQNSVGQQERVIEEIADLGQTGEAQEQNDLMFTEEIKDLR
jgi:hypothetical protein